LSSIYYSVLYYVKCLITDLLVLLAGRETMTETKKTGIDVVHDLVQRVDLSTDQGHARRGILGVDQMSIHT
jgi:hypothetical protein